MMLNRAKQTGFTLGELMITVAIVGILAAVAFPTYTNYVVKTRRAEGTEALQVVAEALERHFTERQRYTTDMTSAFPVGLALASDPLPSSPNGYYTVTIAAATGPCPIATCFSISATPVLPAQVVDGVLTLDSRGNKTRAGNPGWD